MTPLGHFELLVLLNQGGKKDLGYYYTSGGGNKMSKIRELTKTSYNILKLSDSHTLKIEVTTAQQG